MFSGSPSAIKERENKMGMYTELHFNAELKKDLPKEVLNVFDCWFKKDNKKIGKLPDHPFFKDTRWRQLTYDGSYYFDMLSGSFIGDECKKITTDPERARYISIRGNLKNYANEVGKFIDWIMPYLDKFDDDFLGFHRYEESEMPTLIFYKKNAKEKNNE